MDADGKQLSLDGRRELSAFFVQSGQKPLEKLVVVKDFAVSNASIIDENSADVFVEYVFLGWLDSATALFEQGAISALKEREEYRLVRTSQNGQTVSANTTAQDELSPLEWKIQGPLRNPRITLDTAIRYVTETRDYAGDLAVKTNANHALATLNSIRNK